jgi:phenylalanyl-tRNA synthetase beta chain
MVISYQWLLEYLPEPLPVNELSNILTSIGLEVEAVEPVESIRGGLEGLVIGEVLTCEKHPNADKLSVTTVNVGGSEALQIVCGAPNVAAGQKVVVATVGTTVHPIDGESFLIKKAKIRGEESAGMICAEDEIGLGESHAGIMILPADAVIGTLAKTYFNIPETDFAIHIGLTPNRSDANSHIGVARDVCAWLSYHRGVKSRVRTPSTNVSFEGPVNPIKINIEAAEACQRYAGIGISGVKVGPSPEWLKQKLQAIGVRSINNIVDVTNYVLHEYGQPLHAFDADKIAGNVINVRMLPEHTVFTGLDDKERKLLATDLMICDQDSALAMGGVFGGKTSGITDATSNVFLESAYFTPKFIRRTSLYHNLRTDAATHFEKGVDISNVIPALQRAAALITEVSGGVISSSVTDVYPAPLEATTVTVTYDYIHKLSGKSYHKGGIREILLALGFGIAEETAEGLTLKVPSNKTDVSQPADIVEEILRIDGLDNVQISDRLNISLSKAGTGGREIRERFSELLCGMGLQEIITNSIVNSNYYPDRTDLVHMINSLSTELDVMRPSMLEGGLDVIQYNCNRKSQDLALFEMGNVYDGTILNKFIAEKGNEGARLTNPKTDKARLALWITGNMRTADWEQKAQRANIFHLKGLLDTLMKYGGITNTALSFDETNGVTEINWKWKNQPLCSARKVSAERLKLFDIKQDVFYAEIYWDVWAKAVESYKISYKEVPKFPAVQRDLAIVIDTDVTYRQVQDTTEQLKLESLQSYGLFDVFESEQLGQGKKSYALNYIFQLQDRTLTDVETEQLMKKLSDAYKNKLSAQIRE